MSLAAGTKFGPYEIVSPLGAGGMGEVYRARDTKLGREVAVKVLPESVSADPERLARFEREARALASLNHPNIVTVYSVEEAGGVRLLAMELVEGSTLDLAIPAEGLPLPRFFEIAMPLADALSAAHERGIVHRDLKPANVMLTREGRLKVLDFGLAKLVASNSDPNATDMPTESRAQLTGEGAVFGTVAYMSPEQARGGNVDARSDVFSLGVVLYEMLTGERPFKGSSSVDVISSILRDSPSPVTEIRADLPAHVGRILRRCLAKEPRDRYQTSRDVFNELRELQTEASAQPPKPAAAITTRANRAPSSADSGQVRDDESFRVAVLPFKFAGASAELKGLADGLSEEIVTGLSRFSYLRVIARGSTARYSSESGDVRTIGKELGARYVMEGTLRQAGARVRLAVQLVDTDSGAHLWAETYERAFHPDAVFELQDELAPRIVSTVADMNGVLARSMSEAVRSFAPDQMSPYEAVLRSFGYFERVTPEELAAARSGLELAVRKAPQYADAWAMLANLYVQDYAQGFNLTADSLSRGVAAAQRAVEAAPSGHLACCSLAQALFFQKELQSFRHAAQRAAALNPMDGNSIAFLGELLTYAGDRERGLALASRAKQLNPNHPGWYWYADFYDAYDRGDYRGALSFVIKANLPGHWGMHAAMAATYAQLGERDAAAKSLRDLLTLRPAFADEVRTEFEKWWKPAYVEAFLDGLRKAGLDIDGPARVATAGPAVPEAGAAVSIAVLPFSDMSAAKDQEYLCEGMAEEIMNALVRVNGIRVASRTSAFRARQEGRTLPEIARLLSVSHVLEGSVRSSGTRLRVTAQLTEVATGFQLWSERFDREAADVFAVQDEIAAGVVEAVRARLAPGTHAVPARPQPANLEAYRFYLQGRHLRGKEHLDGALRAFGEAVRLEPSHAPSWTGLAEATVLASIFGILPAREACATARKALVTANELQGESADGLHVEAFVAWIERRWDAMEAAWRRAIEIQPTHVLSLASFGVVLCTRRRLDEGLPYLERARQADPLSSFPYQLTGGGLLNCGRPQEALRFLEDALSFDRDDAAALDNAGQARVVLGRVEEGIATLEHVVAVSHRAPHFLGTLGWALANAGRKDDARKILEELRTRPKSSPPAVSEAWLLGGLGEIDAAFEVITRAEEERVAYLYFTGVPGFDPLRADPRFGAFLQRLGLPS